MPTTRGEIPEISGRRLGYLARIIRPVVSLTTIPMGRWPQDEVRTFYLQIPKDLRGHNLARLRRRYSGPVRLVEQVRMKTFHRLGSAGRVFHPTIAEVLAQIPERHYDENCLPANRVVAFETFLENLLPDYDESGRFHVATTVLLVPGSKPSGELQRAHFS